MRDLVGDLKREREKERKKEGEREKKEKRGKKEVERKESTLFFRPRVNCVFSLSFFQPDEKLVADANARRIERTEQDENRRQANVLNQVNRAI